MIGGEAVKGPLAGMLETLGHERSAPSASRAVLAAAGGGFVLDEADRSRARGRARARAERGLVPTLMHDTESSAAVAARGARPG